MSQVCSFYHQLCPEGNLTEDKCIQATAGRCQLKLEECKLEMTMDYLNTSPEDGSPVTCGQKFSSTSNNTIAKGRIVGGSVTSPGSWPWLVNLRLNGDLMCGGVLLDDMWILTAAHCFTGNVNLLQWTVVVGQYDLSKKVQGEKTFQVNRIVTHPKFNQKTFDNDLALLELTSSVTASESARPVCLPPVPIDPAPGTNCYIAGWGSLYEDGPLSDVIMEAHVPVLSQEACRGTLGKDMLTSTMFCAGYLTGGIDSCQGDSGGPLTCQDPISKQYVLYGITSWGDGCGERGKPGIYTRVTAFTDWISHQIKKSPPIREPTCFELSELGILHEKGISSLCSFYRTLCPVPLSQEACTRLTEERCKQKQRRCELHSYLQTLLSLLRRAEHFLRDNMDFSFFTQTIPQFMEQVYSNIFTSRVRRDIQIQETEIVDKEIRHDTSGKSNESSEQTENNTESNEILKNKSFELLFQNWGPGLQDWMIQLRKMMEDEDARSLQQFQADKQNIAMEKKLFLQRNDDTVKTLEVIGWNMIHMLKSELRMERAVNLYLEMPALEPKSIADHSQIRKREVTQVTEEEKENLGGCGLLVEAGRKVQSIKEKYRWILQVPERDLSMNFQEILVDMNSKNGKGLYRARVRVQVAGKPTSFISLVGLENSSLYRSMPGIIALSMDVLKT
ncbi:serine protease 56-like [Xenopus laevis]|uniref:Serine protease 56-like n=1 Tax=Xenopus laevis TaxID=8355 RepID=A0A8J1KPC5_XENLA|nr:serine protease 56-like [Xenopus laevis]